MLVGMVQFVVSLVCSREAKTLQDTFHIPITAVTNDIFALDRPREECDADATVQAISSRVLLIIQLCTALLCNYFRISNLPISLNTIVTKLYLVIKHYAQQDFIQHYRIDMADVSYS